MKTIRKNLHCLVKDNLSYFIKFGVIGGLSTLTHWLILVGLVELFQLESLIASSIGFIGALLISFPFNLKWTFGVNERNANHFMKYVAVCIIGFFLNNIIMYFFLYVIGLWYFYSQIICVFFVTPSNYLMNRYWTFKSVEIDQT